jgi:hypothetical protein
MAIQIWEKYDVNHDELLNAAEFKTFFEDCEAKS